MLKRINTAIKKNHGVIHINTPRGYSQLTGYEFTREELRKYGINKWLTQPESKMHPLWRALAEEDLHLLEEYVDVVFAQQDQFFDNKSFYSNTNKSRGAMGLYISSYRIPHMRHWHIGGISGGSYAHLESILALNLHGLLALLMDLKNLLLR